MSSNAERPAAATSADPTDEPFDSARFLATLTSHPGVYRMLDQAGKVIYVGKARNLKRRVSSYFRREVDSPKTRAMVAQIRAIDITVTQSEGEALLLENQLIKSLKPRYNILLRDDKSYPYILLSTDQTFPRLAFHRGGRGSRGRYFGPYPSGGAVRETLNLLQKVFRVRQCRDSFFRNRSRPCLEYQIERCTAPCVDYISAEDYAEDVRHTRLFLEGRDHQVVDELVAQMEKAAAALDYEQAAVLRDRIAKLRLIQQRHNLGGDHGDMDVLACELRNGVACVELFMARGGHNLGNKSFFPRLGGDEDAAAILSAFVHQYYLGRRDVPPTILVSLPVDDAELLEQLLRQQSGRKVSIRRPQRGQAVRWLQLAETNLGHSLDRRLAGNANVQRRLQALQEALGLDSLPQRLECFDISHTMGEGTVASCVVYGADGPLKSDYRRFNIEGITPGDDFAAMQQALQRRYTRLKKGEGKQPDILLIDGGKGQLAQAIGVMEELQLHDILLVGVAKGPTRKPGLETLFLAGDSRGIRLPMDSPALHLIQQVRDEAHRFAITSHRQRRAKARRQSVLETIPGLGPKRRRALLNQFGGLREVSAAGIEDLAKVHGISRPLAERVYSALHDQES